MQTILGSGGSIGTELARSLLDYTPEIRLVSRKPTKVNVTDQLMAADITDKDQLYKAVDGSEVVYITVGFPYHLKSWTEKWPPFMDNVIEACKANDSKLVFFDNIYMYDENYLDGMNEDTPVNPSSKKGKVRAHIAGRITDEIQSGSLRALIARAADFYGPSIRNSVLIETVFLPLSKGKKATWLGRDNVKHSYTYTPDAGKATAILGNSDDAYGEVWHLPTAAHPMNGKEWVEKVAHQFKTEPKYRVVSKNMVRIAGLFNSVLKESVEMMYQFDRPYEFDSSKFEKTFNFSPTPYDTGIKHIIDQDYN